MVPGLNRARLARRAALAGVLAGLAAVAPRVGVVAALLLSIWWVARRDDAVGTWGVFYILLLLILGVLTLLLASLALVHRLAGG